MKRIIICFPFLLILFIACQATNIESTSTPPSSMHPSPNLIMLSEPGQNGHPTLADFWHGQAKFIVEVQDTGLPMGESDTIVMHDTAFWSYLHASDRSVGAIDQCGQPVEFPGCTVFYSSYDNGYHFQPIEPTVCLFQCQTCPCDSKNDHIDQQQYPRVFFYDGILTLVYEYQARIMIRRSANGLTWTNSQEIIGTGIWKKWLRNCQPEEEIGNHPFVPYDYECLAGGPPGIYIENDMLYVFMGMGQNPGSMGCYKGDIADSTELMTPCDYNPLFTGTDNYGPVDEKGSHTNQFFGFRMLSSSEVQKVDNHYYMLYEGIRGAGPGDNGDSQFGLGLARTMHSTIDGEWETFSGNPILVDLPGNIGLGHADLVVFRGQTLLYTSLDGITRSRLQLVWWE